MNGLQSFFSQNNAFLHSRGPKITIFMGKKAQKYTKLVDKGSISDQGHQTYLKTH